MHYAEAIVFGIVQGITEFIPISSTAHIIITELLLGYRFPGLAFEIILHIASVFAVALYYRRELVHVLTGFFSYFQQPTPENRVYFLYGLYILLATGITGVLGLLLKNVAAEALKTPVFMGFALMVTGIFLIIIERFRTYGRRTEDAMTYLDAVVVGFGQAISVLPGVSRSGATLVAALWAGLSRETAVRYSFLLLIPVILGSSVLAWGDPGAEIIANIGLGPLLVSFLTSFVFSLLGIAWLINFLRRGRLLYFAVYCFIVAFLLFANADRLMPA